MILQFLYLARCSLEIFDALFHFGAPAGNNALRQGAMPE
jgi:hypothetical protein